MILPSVNPRAGETNRLPNTVNAPDSGDMAAISPLETKCETHVCLWEWRVDGLQCDDNHIDEHTSDDVGEYSTSWTGEGNSL